MDVIDDGSGALWIASWGGGLLHYEPASGELRRHVIPPERSRGADRFMQLLIDRLGRLWVATWGDGLALFDAEDETFTLLRHDPADPESLSDDYVTCLAEGDEGGVWVGTGQRGFNALLQLDTGAGRARFRRYRGRDGLSNEDIYSLQPDGEGRMWIGTNDGLNRFDPASETFTVFTGQDGLQDSEFNERASDRGADGTLYFGGPQGFNRFDPDDFWRNQTPPPVVLTDFLLFNRSLPIGRGSLLEQSIGVTEELVLSYRDAMFAFEFTALNYRQPERNRYAYRLEAYF
jgi:ligand-binding sensor domain-containing protein